MLNTIKKKEIFWGIPIIIHFLLTFVWDGFIFVDTPYDIGLKIINDVIPLKLEQGVHFVYAKIIAIILIFVFWNGIKCLVNKRTPVREKIIFISIFLILSIFNFFTFSTYYVSDNLTTFSHAIRNLPHYWHGALTSIYHSACYYFFPTPLTISEINIAIFSACVTYFTVYKKKYRLFFVVFLIIPYSKEVLQNIYRAEIFVIYLILSVAVTIHLIENKISLKGYKLFAYLALIAFVSVWRTEGILLGLVQLILYLIICFKKEKYKVYILLVVTGIMMVFLVLPQKMGDIKYHGKDYTIINTFAWLQPIFNDPDANLSYDGVNEDIEAINQIIPVEWIKQAGHVAWWTYNEYCGRFLCQTCASSEDADAYMNATFRIVSHNITTVMKVMINNITISKSGLALYQMDGYSGSGVIPDGIDTYRSAVIAWDIGANDYNANPVIQALFHSDNSKYYLEVKTVIDKILSLFNDRIDLFWVTLFSGIFIVFKEITLIMSNILKSRKFTLSNLWYIKTLVAIGLIQVLVVSLGAPTPNFQYYHATYYFIMFLISHIAEKKINIYLSYEFKGQRELS